MKKLTLLVYGEQSKENQYKISDSINSMINYIKNLEVSDDQSESKSENIIYFNDFNDIIDNYDNSIDEDGIDGILILYDKNATAKAYQIMDNLLYILTRKNCKINNDIIGVCILDGKYSEIQHVRCNKYELIDTVLSNTFIFKPVVSGVKRRIYIETRNNDERNFLGEKLHNQLRGNPDYINSNIVLNIDTDKAVNLYIFDDCKDIPELKI